MPEDSAGRLFPDLTALTCPKCGGPLPPLDSEGFATCTYCGVRSSPATAPITADQLQLPGDESDDGSGDSREAEYEAEKARTTYWLRIIVGVVTLVICIASFAASSPSQPQATQTGTTGSPCTAYLSASPTSGPPPLLVTFDGSATGSYSSPSWVIEYNNSIENTTWLQGGFTLNYTFDNVGPYSVTLEVPNQDGGCWAHVEIDVT